MHSTPAHKQTDPAKLPGQIKLEGLRFKPDPLFKATEALVKILARVEAIDARLDNERNPQPPTGDHYNELVGEVYGIALPVLAELTHQPLQINDLLSWGRPV